MKFRIEARVSKNTPIVKTVSITGSYSDAEKVMFELMREGLRWVDIKDNQ